MSYAYIVLEKSLPICGGGRKYHINWHLNKDKDSQEKLKRGIMEIWRLTPSSSANISEDFIEEKTN